MSNIFFYLKGILQKKTSNLSIEKTLQKLYKIFYFIQKHVKCQISLKK